MANGRYMAIACHCSHQTLHGLVGLRVRPRLEQMPVILEHGGISLVGRK